MKLRKGAEENVALLRVRSNDENRYKGWQRKWERGGGS
jgi:hypothetical protein